VELARRAWLTYPAGPDAALSGSGTPGCATRSSLSYTRRFGFDLLTSGYLLGTGRRTVGVEMDSDNRLTPGLLIEKLGLYAGPAVWAYREAVVAAAANVGITVNHDLGLVQIGLELAGKPELQVGWRIDHGWYLVQRNVHGQPPAVGPTRYRPGADPLDQLLPEPNAVAQWLCDIDNRGRLGTVTRPNTSLTPGQTDTVLKRLHGYLLRAPRSPLDYTWPDDRPLTREDHHIAG
jgi:hypothetical protein